ncbi:MAG: hypothetical protein PHF00_13210 [Elusimicrobia bacterium]|nr:hypothetical protein [Elusimicrobiota bacterium]
MLRRSFLLTLIALLLSGCLAETVRKNRPRKGPIREVGYVDLGGGEVRYSMEGWSWFVAGRRRDALRRMRRVCRGLHPVITEEIAREDVDVPFAQDDISVTLDRGSEHYAVAPFIHIAFECAQSTGPAAAAPRPAGPAVRLADVEAAAPEVPPAASTVPAAGFDPAAASSAPIPAVGRSP